MTELIEIQSLFKEVYGDWRAWRYPLHQTAEETIRMATTKQLTRRLSRLEKRAAQVREELDKRAAKAPVASMGFVISAIDKANKTITVKHDDGMEKHSCSESTCPMMGGMITHSIYCEEYKEKKN